MKKIKPSERIPLLYVSTTQGASGTLAKGSGYVFSYLPALLAAGGEACAVSLTMPLRAAPWQSGAMLPAFQTFLPEGFLRERIQERFGKTMRMDDMALLALSGSNAIGRVRVSTAPVPDGDHHPAESLAEVLADQGSRDLFEYLCDRYLISSGVAGVQPKVLLEATEELPPRKLSPSEHSTLRAHRLIVKISGADFPGLTENEFHCMRIAQRVGLPTPAHWLSADRKRLAIERFDYDTDTGSYLGFEDMVALQGRTNERKYEGSYESIATAIKHNVSPLHLHESLRSYFRLLVLCVLLRNGDAHLKNFGLLYTDPTTDDCRLSPVYDLVCTTAFIPRDQLALKLAGTRQWPSAHVLAEFGRDHCQVDDAMAEIRKLTEQVMAYAPEEAPDGMWRRMQPLLASAATFTASA